MESLVLALLSSILPAPWPEPAKGTSTAGPKPPNVLLIVLDDVGFEKLDWWPFQPFASGVTGNPPTPTLQALASEGLAFTRSWTSPSCSPSRAQILTGRNSHRTGVGAPMRPQTNPHQNLMSDAELLLPELIRAGDPAYRTGAFGKWHVVEAGRECHPTQNGFEIFQGHMFNVTELDATAQGSCLLGHHFWWDKVTSPAGSGCASTVRRGQETGPYPQDMWRRWSSTETRLDALAWIESIPPSEPFFAYVAFNSPHEPLQVPPTSLVSTSTANRIAQLSLPVGYVLPCTQTPADPCEGCSTFVATACPSSDPPAPPPALYHPLRIEILNWMIESVDTEIAHLITGLGDRLDDTVVVVVSDNGTAQTQVDCPLNPRHAKLWPYQLGARVPLIVWGPRVVAKEHEGAVCERLVGSVDLFRTIAELTGMSPAQIDAVFAQQPTGGQHPSSWTLDSMSFSHWIADPTGEPPVGVETREFALFEHFTSFRPHWLIESAEYRRGVVHESGLKLTHLDRPPAGNLPLDLLHLPNDPDEFLNLARFLFDWSDQPAPCDGIALGAPKPPCPFPPCMVASSSFYNADCLPMQPDCDAQILAQILGTLYVPSYCADTTSN